MFSRNQQYIKTNEIDPKLFIDGNDYRNSSLLNYVNEYVNWKYYLVTQYERRIDLISKYLYGNESYSWILLYMNKIKNDDIIRGMKLRYIPLDNLLNFISRI